jgi:hypothetical protein
LVNLSHLTGKHDDYCSVIAVAQKKRPRCGEGDIGACFLVKDSSGQKLGYFYYEEEPGRCA